MPNTVSLEYRCADFGVWRVELEQIVSRLFWITISCRSSPPHGFFDTLAGAHGGEHEPLGCVVLASGDD